MSVNKRLTRPTRLTLHQAPRRQNLRVIKPGFPSTQNAQPSFRCQLECFRNQLPESRQHVGHGALHDRNPYLAAKSVSLGEDIIPYCILLGYVGLWEARAIEFLMSFFGQHALSALLEQQRYDEIAPQLDEDEMRVCEQYTSHANKSVSSLCC